MNNQPNYLLKTARWFVVIFMVVGLVASLSAQDNNETSDNEANQTSETINNDNQSTNSDENVFQSETGLTKIVTNLVNDFEQAGKWYGTMYSDYGWVQVQRRRGYAKVGDISLREQLGKEKSSYTLGLKVHFNRVYFSHAEIFPPSDIQLYGKVKKLTVWAFGKNTHHKLYAVVEDARGRIYRAPFFFNQRDDTLNFEAWQKMNATIPRDAQFRGRYQLAKKRVIQLDNTQNQYYNPEGIKFKGFWVDFDAIETTRLFYLYLDQLEYVTDIYRYEKYQESTKVPEDEISYPLENW